jgi:hypothetical protein
MLAPALAENWSFLQIKPWPKCSRISVFGWDLSNGAYNYCNIPYFNCFQKLDVKLLNLHVPNFVWKLLLSWLIIGAITITQFLQMIIIHHENVCDILLTAIRTSVHWKNHKSGPGSYWIWQHKSSSSWILKCQIWYSPDSNGELDNVTSSCL